MAISVSALDCRYLVRTGVLSGYFGINNYDVYMQTATVTPKQKFLDETLLLIKLWAWVCMMGVVQK